MESMCDKIMARNGFQLQNVLLNEQYLFSVFSRIALTVKELIAIHLETRI